MCHVINLWISFEKNLIVGCWYKSNMVLKRGTMCPLATGAPKKPGLDTVMEIKRLRNTMTTGATMYGQQTEFRIAVPESLL